ncbi:tyrosine-type recombinase/integrase [candidate division KSB1 bacterium]|nr:tyrosine-type recombinase/integrase [candidate division KSB1 bacterium]
MASLRKRQLKHGWTWVLDYSIYGRRKIISTGTQDRKTAELIKKDIELNIAKRRFDLLPQKPKVVFLKDFYKEYYNFSKQRKSKNTSYIDKHCLKLFKAFVGNISLTQLNTRIAERYISHRLTKVRPTTVNIETRSLKCAFNHAIRWGYLRENPFAEIKQLKVNLSPPRFLTLEEIKKLREVIKDKKFKILIEFYLNTGARRMEALTLTWKDIDAHNNTIILRGKGGKSRRIPIKKKLIDLLNTLEPELFDYRPDYVDHKFKNYCRKVGICDISIHNLRKTYASYLVMSYVSIFEVSKLLGHSSVLTTERHYSSLAPDFLKQSIEKLPY